MEKKLLIGIKEKPENVGQWILLSLQHVFAMFGATVLVPLLTGLDVGIALVASGIGTLIYIFCTKGKAPVYLGSSFAYIAAIVMSVLNSANALAIKVPNAFIASKIKDAVVGDTIEFSTINSISVNGVYGVKEAIADELFTFADVFSSALIGLMIVGAIYIVVAILIKFVGSEWLKKLLPPVVIGPMIIIIGLGLAPVAIGSAGLNGGQGWAVPLVATVTFISVVGIALVGKGFFKIVPFLIAILIGYSVATIITVIPNDITLISFSTFDPTNVLVTPNFTIFGTYAINWSAVLMFVPLAFVTIAEHIGDHTVLGEICGEDFITDPGLDKTLLGDGIATLVSGALGGPANTTYGENTGVVAMTKIGSVYVIGLAAIFAILLGFIGYIQWFITSIPWAVIGGMTVVLYGLIAGNGVKVLINSKVDLGKMKNLIIVATMLVIGLGGASIAINDAASLSGMSLAAIVGIVLNGIFVLLEKYNLITE